MKILGIREFNKGDNVYHKRLQKECIFIKYLDDNICVVDIDGIEKRVTVAFLE